MMEYSYDSLEHYDGVSEYDCKNSMNIGDKKATCDYRLARFCGQELKGGEIEYRYCDGTKPHINYSKGTS